MPPDAPHPLRILLLTDVFPPRSGGSGWSTFYLGKALQARGHDVSVLRPRFDLAVARPALRVVEYEGMRVEEIAVPEAPWWARRIGLGKASRERAARSLMAAVAGRRVQSEGVQVLHGGHALSGVAASLAAKRARATGQKVVSVTTVRDYWPLCPVSTRLFMDPLGRTFECDDCHRLWSYLNCIVRSHAGPSRRSLPRVLLPLASGLARWWLTARLTKRLAECDAVIAVSDFVRNELERSGRVPASRLITIPNLVDLPSVDRALASPWPLHDISPEEPFLLFAGKLDANKGAQMLPEVILRSGAKLPLVVAGDGPLRHRVQSEAERAGLNFRFYDWLDNDAVLRLMEKAKALLFPSVWQEPLSRVLLEGLAAGAMIVAMNTGGTSDAIADGESGLLARNIEQMAAHLQRAVSDGELNTRLRKGARLRAETEFAAPVVSARVEKLYRDLLYGGLAA